MMELQDRISGPAKTIVQNLEQVGEHAQQAHASIKNIAEGVGIERLGEKLLEVGKEFVSEVFEANRFAERTKIAFGVLEGSASQANEVFEQTRRFAVAAGLPLEQVADSYKALRLGGVKAPDIEPILNAAADLAALGPKGVGMEAYVQTFADIQSKGDLAGRSLAAFKGVIDFDSLAKKLGFATHGYEQLAKALTAAPVSAGKGINALLATLAEKEGGVLGTVQKQLGETFSGTVTSIKGELLGLFEFDSSGSPVLEFLHQLRDSLNPGSPFMKGVLAGVDAFLAGLGPLMGPSGMPGLIQSMKDGSIVGAGFRDTMGSIGAVLATVADLLKMVVKGYDLLIHGVDWGYLKEQLGGGTVAGYAKKTVSENPLLQTALLASGVPAFAEGGHVDGPTLALVGDGGEGESIVPDSKMGSAHATLNLEQHFHVTNSGGVDVSELARTLHSIGLGDLQGALDTLAQQMGAA